MAEPRSAMRTKRATESTQWRGLRQNDPAKRDYVGFAMHSLAAVTRLVRMAKPSYANEQSEQRQDQRSRKLSFL